MPGADLSIYPQQLPRIVPRGGVPLREDLLYFDNKGNEKKSWRKLAERALDNLQEILPRLLEPQEAVFCTARVVAPLSFFTLGWQAYHMNGTVLVFTNRRLLRFGIKPKGWGNWVWRRTVRAVRWGDVAEAQVKGFLGTLTLKYRNGRIETYTGLSGAAGKRIKALVGALLPGASAEASAAQEMVSLCPQCLARLTPRVYQCQQCGLAFKNEKTLLWRNYLLPGGGYFYTGWRTFAFLHAFVDSFLLLGMAVWVLIALRFVPPPTPDPGQRPATAAAAATTVAILLLIFLFENTIAWLHNRRFIREFIPAG